MKHVRTSSPQVRALGGLLLALLAILLVGSIAEGSWERGRAPFPFVWRDVALIHALGALPLGCWLSAAIRQRCSAATAGAMATGLLAVGLVPVLVEHDSLLLVGGAPVRLGIALGIVTGAALGVRLLTDARPDPAPTRAAIAVGCAALLIPPTIHVWARTQQDLAQASLLMQQSRYGEAQQVLHAVLRLSPAQAWHSRPLRQSAQDIDRLVQDLEAAVRMPLPTTGQGRLERARQLAMLGRTQAALESLRSITDPALVAEIANLRGTIHEADGAWDLALASFQEGRTKWADHPASAAQHRGLVHAVTGMAYCERQQGRQAEAEAHYQEVLRLAPTADSHFLLAQFFESAQNAEQAHGHAREAMRLDPSRYDDAGAKLIRKLAVHQFGCLGVLRAERSFGQSP